MQLRRGVLHRSAEEDWPEHLRRELPLEALERDIRQTLAGRRLHEARRELRARLHDAYVVENCIVELAAQRGLDE